MLIIHLVSLLSPTFKSDLGKDAVYNFINGVIKESKYCSDVMKKYFNNELAMTKKDDQDFENSTTCWICDNVYVDDDVKVRDYCHITGKYIGSAQRDCNIKVEIGHKIPSVFRNLKKI